MAAIDALKAQGLAPSSNVRVILDGEEEDSSPSLVPAIVRYKDKLRADLMVILDGPGHSSGRPTVVYGARGIATLDLTVYGPKVGVHSGNYGNWMPNPAMRLASLLASMKDEDGRVKVAGYYDAVTPPTPAERAMLDAVPDDSARMLQTFGVAAPEQCLSEAAGRAAGADAEHPGSRELVRRRQRAHDRSGSRDRGDRHPPGEGDARRPIWSRSSARTSRSRATTSSTLDGAQGRRRTTKRERATGSWRGSPSSARC